MIQVSKELHVLSRRLSDRLAGQGQMHECRRRQNAPTSHPVGASVASVTPRHLRRDDVMVRGAWTADAWSVESSQNDVIIIHTHSEVIVAFQHGSQM
jgi:hypothetical protein